jgi:serine phosphatase RsbU (regulator of sigma subunit)
MTARFYIYLFYYRKTQPRIDHLFRRRKYDYYQVLGEIGQKIGSELDINNVVNRLFKELKEVLYIRNGLILVQPPGEEDYTEAGSIGYDAILDSQRAGKVILPSRNALTQWLQARQKVLEREQVEVDPQYESIKEEALAFLSQNSIEVLIPVIMEDKVNAFVGIGKKENLQAYTIKDIELLELMGKQVGITIDNALHHEDIIEKERLAEEMKLGREIQIALLPHESPQLLGLVVQGLMQPAKEIGGDYYDFITLPDSNNLGIVIGDVSGKGVAAGLLMAMAKTAIHTLTQEEFSPKSILMRTNQILSKHIGGERFMTLLYLMWQKREHILSYSSAGHEHILIYRSKTNSVEVIKSGGFMLGMMPNIEPFLEEKKIPLSPGDKVLLYTDGVTEAQNQAEDRFGLNMLKETFFKYNAKPAQELMQAVRDEVYSFIGNYPQYDDITLVVLEAV